MALSLRASGQADIPGEMQIRRPSLRTWLIRAGLTFVLIVAALAGVLWVIDPASFYPRPDFPRLEREGETLIAAIERYHATHGAYPSTLDAAGISAPKTRWGYWRYRMNPDGKYLVSVGEYDRHGFILFKEQGKDWYRDT